MIAKAGLSPKQDWEFDEAENTIFTWIGDYKNIIGTFGSVK
jgi:hypothetical protein